MGEGCPPEAAAALAAAAERLGGGGGGGGGAAGRGRSRGCLITSSRRNCSAVYPPSLRRWGRPRGRGSGGAWALLQLRRPARRPLSAGASAWSNPNYREWKIMAGHHDQLKTAPPMEVRCVHRWWWRYVLGYGACRKRRRRSHAVPTARTRDRNRNAPRAAWPHLVSLISLHKCKTSCDTGGRRRAGCGGGRLSRNLATVCV